MADDYDESEDVLRTKVISNKLENPVEQLNFKIADLGGKKGQIVFQWSSIEIQIPFTSL